MSSTQLDKFRSHQSVPYSVLALYHQWRSRLSFTKWRFITFSSSSAISYEPSPSCCRCSEDTDCTINHMRASLDDNLCFAIKRSVKLDRQLASCDTLTASTSLELNQFILVEIYRPIREDIQYTVGTPSQPIT